MPFYDPSGYPALWEQALPLPDGRQLRFYGNTADDAAIISRRFPEMENEFDNHYCVELELISRGVLFAPEVPAVDNRGREFVDGTYALYHDRRIQVDEIAQVIDWVDETVPSPAEIDVQTQRRLSKMEIKTLVGMAMDQLGVTGKLAQMRAEEARRADLLEDPVKAALQKARELETAGPLEEAAPQHLAQEDAL